MPAPHNRVALVTGAARGIGAASARALLADGWRVAFSGRHRDALEQAIAAAGDPWGDIGDRALAVAVPDRDLWRIPAAARRDRDRCPRLRIQGSIW